ncbi:lactate utilization protein B/C [Niastella caeni]|uniref:Lactate utilization protein B/C n=1 Tax=Niastella caeni TaxID=2569763 RepID=A0A4S8HP78_9BACT|nr:LUD domain-containing protein [Niastella caeni]THU37200.1 lactate utilization protein B/C [Niastella caeni]
MNVSPAKENILKKIRKALSNSTPLPFPQSEGNSSVYQPSQQDLGLEFAQRFTTLQGKFVFCENQYELVVQLKQVIASNKWDKIYCKEEGLRKTLAENQFDNYSYNDLSSCDTAITTCEWLVARTGSIVMSAAQESGRTVSVYAPVHICIAYTSQLVYDVKDALQNAREKYSGNLPSLITFATGPSRTADIEKTLVVGVHGPKEVYVFLIDK